MRSAQSLLLLATVVSVIAGGLAGWYAGPAMTSIAWLGALFLNLLKMLIVPLVLAAMISGITSLADLRGLGRMSAWTLAYFMLSTALAVVLGLGLVNYMQPGAGIALDGALSAAAPPAAAERAPAGAEDVAMSLVSSSLFKAAAENKLLPVIVFALLLGAAIASIGRDGEPAARFFESLNEAMMRVVGWVMYFAPVGIFALVASQLGASGGGAQVLELLSAVGEYVLTVLLGLGAHFCLLTLVVALVRGRPLRYLAGVLRALVTALGTASSSATLPLSMQCVRGQQVDERAVRLVLPLGATVNMNGTALYEAVAVMFIAQAYGIDLSTSQQVIVFLTATLAAIGAAGIPEAGLVTMVLVLTAVGLPVEGTALLLAVDWFLDRFRTSVNVYSDCVGAAVLEHRLPPHPPAAQ